MNHIYRIVWNALTATWVAVAENAHSHGKGSKRSARKAGRRAGGKALTMATLAIVGLAVTAAMAQTVPTTVVPTGGKTVAYTAGNGVPVVDINTANAAGLSHNRFTSYNVDARGLVLNNGNMDQLARLSQLAGQVAGNANLIQQARVILNEVVSTNRSVLAGFTEVLGGRAEVVVANPNGITCTGCGFINTDRITLTTGTPTFGADGSLGGFNVNQGDVLINGMGANATAQQIFDIVARSVKIDGKINTADSGSLGITTGANSWSYTGRNVTGAVAPSGGTASYAIDSTVLGGMYSGRINIIATEAGVGVRMLGEAAASADNFTLTSAGKIELQAVLSAKQDLTVKTTAVSGSEDLLVIGAGKLSGARNLALIATGGQVKLTEGELYAANDLTTTAASLSDASAASRTRFAGGNNTLAITGAASINGSAWGAGGALTGNANSLSIGTSGGTLYAGTTLALATANNLALGTAAVRSAGNMTLTAETGNISIGAGAAQGIQTTAGNLNLNAGGGLTNAGKMTADTGNVTARINGTLNNSGMLQAKTALDIADKTGSNTEDIVNSGILLADSSLMVKATGISNQAGATLQGGTGTTLAANSLNNAGTLIASNTVGQAGAFTLASLTNSGTLQSAGNLDLNLTNALTNTGKVLATNNLTVTANNAALTISNTGAAAVLQAGNALTVNGSNATFDTQSGTVLGNTVGLTLASLNNSGTLQSNDAMTLAVGGALTNTGTGTLLARGGLTSNSATLNNMGTLTAADVAGINSVIRANNVTNSGTLQSAGNLDLNLTNALTNSGKVLATNNLAVTNVGTSALAINNTGAAVLQAGNALAVSGANVSFGVQSGTVLGKTVGLTLIGDLSNAGTLQSNDAMTLAIGGALTNAGILLAKGGLTSTSDAVDNSGTLTLAANTGANGIVNARMLTNSGTLQSAGNLDLNLTNALTNTGKVLATNNLTVTANNAALTISNTTNNTGAAAVLQAGNALTVNGSNATFDTQSGTVLGNTVGLTVARLNNTGTLQSNDAMALVIGGALTNTGTLLAKGGLTSNSASLDNSGTLTAADNVGANGVITTSSVTNRGTLQSAGNLDLNLTTALTNTGKILSTNNLAVIAGASAVTVSNTGAAAVLQAGNALTVNGTNVSFGAQSGTVLGKTVGLTLIGDLTSAGTLQSGEAMALNVAGTLTNTGTLLAKGGLTSMSDAVDNSGTLTLAANTGANGIVNARILTNSGTLQSGGDATLNLSAALVNTGKVLATNNLTVTANNAVLTISNTIDSTGAAAVLQAGNALTVNGSNASFGVQSGTVLGKTVGLTLIGDLNNSGTLQSNDAMALTIGGALTNTGTLLAKGGLTSSSAILNNSGTLTAADVAGINSVIRANSVTNNGTLQSKGNLAMNLATASTNTGSLLAGGDLQIRGTGSTYTVNVNAGRIQAGGVLDIKGNNGNRDVNINVANGATLLGGSMDISAGTLALADNGMVSSTGNMTIGVNNLTFGGSRSSIVAATSGTGAANVTTGMAFNNVGAVHSGGDMTFNAPSITNSGTGAFSALKTLTVNTNSANSGDLDNYGALYAGQTLNVNAMNTLTNRAGATIDSDGDINIDTAQPYANATNPTFTNNSTVNARRNINIAATYFNNNLGANTQRTWTPYYYGNQTYSRTDSSESLSPLTTGWLSGPNASLWCRAAGASANGGICGVSDERRSATWTRSQSFSGYTPAVVFPVGNILVPVGNILIPATGVDPTTAVKPQIIAGGTTTISNFQTAFNQGGVISGHSVSINSSRGYATFTNDDLRLATETGTLNSTEYGYWAGVPYVGGTLRYTYGGGLQMVYPVGTTTLDGKPGMLRTNEAFTSSTNSGIFANGGTLLLTGFSLINIGSTTIDSQKPTSITAKTQNGVAASGLAGVTGASGASMAGTAGAAATGAAGATGVAAIAAAGATGVAAIAAAGATGVTRANGLPAIAFAGLVINLPTNPNGYFVLSTNPSARYLVETNPRFVSGQGSLGSDYLFKRYGLDPDAALKRLGDANYEAYLVRQQLIAQTGNNILAGFSNEADQMKRLMDQAADQGKAAGFVFGKALTSDQIADLKTDVLWMVETTVAGQRVLAPVVYLAPATRLAVVTGAVIAGTNVKMDLASLTNTGGTIRGSNSLQVVSKGDITNTAGTLTGGNVALQSTDGSIKNITTVQGNVVSKTGTITATGNLSLDAKKDITVLGGTVKAGGDASLTAGNNVTFDTIVKTETTSATTASDDGKQRSSGSSTTTTTTNVGSLLESGGKLAVKSGKDTTIAGSTVNARGGLDVDAGGNFNVLARQDTRTTRSETTTSGQGVGGGVLGTETVTVDTFKGTNVGSSINAGTGNTGDLVVKTGGSMTMQGSNVNVAGNAAIDAKKGVSILDGLDESRTTTKTETSAFLKTSGGGSASSGTSANASADAGTKGNSKAGTQANAKAGANAEASGSGSVTLLENTSTVTQSDSRKSVASNFNVKGNLTAKTEGTLLMQGSKINAGGAVDINAKAGIRVVDGENTERTTTTTVTTSLLKLENNGQANAGANAGSGAGGDASKGNVDKNIVAKATGNGKTEATEKPGANAQANAGAEAKGDASGSSDLKLFEGSVTTSQSGSRQSVASGISAGRSLKATTEGTTTLRGSNLSAGEDVDLKSKNTEVLAGRNETFSNTQTVRASVGLFRDVDAAGSAGASAQGNLGTGNKDTGAKSGANAGAKAGVSGSANVEATLGARGEFETTTASTLTNTGSTISAGRNVSIKATETAKFVGAQVSSGGDLTVDAKNIVTLAAQDTTSSSSVKGSGTAGLYAEVNAKADASASVGKSNSASAGASLEGSAGVSVKATLTAKEDGSTTQQVSSFKAGGNITRSAKEGITDQGTQLEAGGNINQTARTLTEIDARDSKFSTSTTSSMLQKRALSATAAGEASASGGAGGTLSAGVRGEARGSVATESESSSKAVTSRYKAGGDINSTTTEKTTLIGTQFTSGGNTQINAGSLDYKAAQDTSSKTSNSTSAGIAMKVEVNASLVPSGSLDANMSNEGKSEKTTTARAGGFNAGGNVVLNVRDDVKLEGTKIESGGKTAITAGGNVELSAARDTKESSDYKVVGSVGFDSSKAGMGLRANGEVSAGGSASSTAQAGSIKSGDGGTSITAGKDVKLEGTKLDTTGNTSLQAGGKVELKAAESTSTSVATGVSGSFGAQKGKNDAGKSETTGSAEVSGKLAVSNKVESQAVAINSGSGDVTISAPQVVNQKADIKTDGATKIIGEVTDKKAENSSVSVSVNSNVSKETKPKTEAKPKAEPKPKPKVEPKTKTEVKPVTKPQRPAVPPQTEPANKPAGEPGKAGNN